MFEYLDRRYALALYQIAKKNDKIDQYLDDLTQIIDFIKTDEDFRKLIAHPHVSTSNKKDIFTQIYKEKIDEDLLSFLLLLIDKKRILGLEGNLKEYEKIRLDKKNMVTAEIKTVVPLLENERKDLINRLHNKYNKTIILNEQIDSKILGGVYVRVGDEVIDGTVKSKIDDMRKLMLKRE